MVRVEKERPVALVGKAADTLRGALVAASGRSKVPVAGETGALGRPLERLLRVRSRRSLVLARLIELGTTNAGSALRAAASAGLDGAAAVFVMPVNDKLLVLDPVRLRLERPAV